jgi:hypothetical protein
MEKGLTVYVTDEASLLLVRLRAELRPSDADVFEAKQLAARNLLNAIVKASEGTGVEAHLPKGGGVVLSLSRCGHATVRLNDLFTKAFVQAGDPAQMRELEIVYDAGARAFVGVHDDPNYVPLPGGPRTKKRNAVTVVVEAAIEEIRRVHDTARTERL